MIEINLALGGEGRRASGAALPLLRLPELPGLPADPRALAAGGAGMLLLAFAVHAFLALSSEHSRLEGQLAEEARDSARYATTIALVQSVQAREDTVRQKIAVIREVDGRRYVWPHLMDEISAAVPAYTWLTSIVSTEADSLHQSPGLSLQGHAGSTQSLTRLMKNLESSPFIRDVTLVTSEQVLLDGRAVHKFTLEARYETPDSSAIATVPVVSLD